jgi:hypothetical protein
MKTVMRRYENDNIKITVEELSPFHYIATSWDKTDCLENDRKVHEFETFGGACGYAFDLLSEYLEEAGNGVTGISEWRTE